MASFVSPTELEWQEKHVKDNAVPDLIAANVVCFSLACIAGVLKFAAPKVAKIKYQDDDWLILAGPLRSHSLEEPNFDFNTCLFSSQHFGY